MTDSQVLENFEVGETQVTRRQMSDLSTVPHGLDDTVIGRHVTQTQTSSVSSLLMASLCEIKTAEVLLLSQVQLRHD